MQAKIKVTKVAFQFVNVSLCDMDIWHLSREIRAFFFVCVFFFSPYHSWVPLQLGLPQICPAVGWGSHRWRQPERCRTRRTAWAGQPATAARSHSLMRWNPVAWRGMHTHAHRGRWACRKRAKGTLLLGFTLCLQRLIQMMCLPSVTCCYCVINYTLRHSAEKTWSKRTF